MFSVFMKKRACLRILWSRDRNLVTFSKQANFLPHRVTLNIKNKEKKKPYIVFDGIPGYKESEKCGHSTTERIFAFA
jgi:hypothetical protein